MRKGKSEVPSQMTLDIMYSRFSLPDTPLVVFEFATVHDADRVFSDFYREYSKEGMILHLEGKPKELVAT